MKRIIILVSALVALLLSACQAGVSPRTAPPASQPASAPASQPASASASPTTSPAPAATAQATAAPTAAATAQTQNGPVVVSGPCPQPREVNNMIGGVVGSSVKENSEACLFEFQIRPPAVPTGTFKCPEGFFCTIHKSDNKVVVVVGHGQSYDKPVGMSIRFRGAYPETDPARNNVCGIVAKENEKGREEDPTFQVTYEQATPSDPDCKQDPSLLAKTANGVSANDVIGWCVNGPNLLGCDMLKDTAAGILGIITADGGEQLLKLKGNFTVGGRCFAFNMPAGFKVDNWNGTAAQMNLVGPQTISRSCEASIRKA